MNMYNWVDGLIYGGRKKAFPLVTYPSVQLLYVTVRELVANSSYQALGMRLIADRYDMPAAVSYMDLSVEAEAFGANAVYGVDDVPTITGSIVETEEQANSLRVPEVGDGRTGITVEDPKSGQAHLRPPGDRKLHRPVFSCRTPYERE